MGIDIRDGSQLECIHCALCIDACDDIMRKVGRPTGLIAYDTDKAVSTRASGGKVVYKLIRTRTVLYTILIALISGLILWGYTAKSNYEFNVLKDRSPPYIRLSDGRVRNGYTLKIVNKASEQTSVAVSLEGLKDAEFEIVGVGSAAADGTLELKSEAHGVGRYRMLVTLPENETERRTTLTVRITDLKSGEVASENTPFVMGDR